MPQRLPWLVAGDPFPPPDSALDNPPGLVAAGADLTPDLLRAAYRLGIFPWYQPPDPVLWWSPDPRCVIAPDQFRPSKTLRQAMRRGGFRFSTDRCFDAVIGACAEPRSYADETWITPDIRAAYGALHRSGEAHSIEVWQEDALVGGLYGVSVGNLFCGESMFSRCSNASKLAFWALMCLCQAWRQPWVDCQLVNDHLLSLGAGPMPRNRWLAELETLAVQPAPDWRQAEDLLAAAGFASIDP